MFKLTKNRKFVFLFKIEFLSNNDKTYFRIIRVRLEKKRCSVKSKIRDVFHAIDRNYIIDQLSNYTHTSWELRLNYFCGDSRLQSQPISDSVVMLNLIIHDIIADTEGLDLDLISNRTGFRFLYYTQCIKRQKFTLL